MGVKTLVVLPILLVVVWAWGRRLLGRGVNPADLRALVGLLVGVYLLGTAALGLFWMSRMELPVFEWHYLAGYGLLFVAAWHLWLEWPQLFRVFQRSLATVRTSGWRWVALGALLVAFLALGWIRRWEKAARCLEPGGEALPAAVVHPNPTLPASSSIQTPKEGGQRSADPAARQAVRYLLRESAASLGGLVRRGLFFGPKVASLRDVGGKPLLLLPPPLAVAPRGLAGSLAWLARPQAPRCGAPTLPELSTLLFAAAGVTEVRTFGLETVRLRAAPSAGALYPVEVYLVRTGEGELPPGVFAYVPEKHGLLPVAGSADARAWARALGMPEGTAVSGPLFVFTTVFQRTVWKYGSRSYRYVALDAGHALANLWLAAAAFSWPVEITPFFSDPEAEALLASSPEEEGVMAVGVCGGLPSAPRVVPPFAELPVEGSWEGQELTRLSHKLTRWQWREGEPWVWQPRFSGAGGQPVAQGADLLALIRNRRSFRRFASEPLAAGQLATVLSRIEPMAASAPGGEGVEVRVVVVRDEALAPGVYRWRGGWQLVRAGSFGRALYRAGLSQELLERAAAAVVFSLDEELLASAFGRRGYRLGLLATGMLGQVTYLAAGEVGLKACGVGAFADDELSRLLQLPEGTHPVYLVALGKG